MTSTAISSQGTTFEVNTAASGAAQPTWTNVANIKSYSGFDGSATEIDVTDMNSEAKETRLGLQAWGSFSLDANINYADPGQAAMYASKKASTALEYKLTLPDGSAKQFTAYCKSFPIAGGTDTVITGTIALTITGDVTDVAAGA